MSNLAEKKAKEIAKKLEASQAYKFDNFSVVCGAIECYDQAMQDFLEKTCEWLKDNSKKYVVCYEDGYSHYAYNSMIDDFKNYMQDE